MPTSLWAQAYAQTNVQKFLVFYSCFLEWYIFLLSFIYLFNNSFIVSFLNVIASTGCNYHTISRYVKHSKSPATTPALGKASMKIWAPMWRQTYGTLSSIQLEPHLDRGGGHPSLGCSIMIHDWASFSLSYFYPLPPSHIPCFSAPFLSFSASDDEMNTRFKNFGS